MSHAIVIGSGFGGLAAAIRLGARGYRVTVLEHMLQEKSVIDRKQLNEYVPQGDLAKELERERAALIERVAGAPHATSYTFESLARQADVG